MPAIIRTARQALRGIADVITATTIGAVVRVLPLRPGAVGITAVGLAVTATAETIVEVTDAVTTDTIAAPARIFS